MCNLKLCLLIYWHLSVKKRPYMGNDSRDIDLIGAVAVEHRGEPSPPMALSFCKVIYRYHYVQA